MNSVNRTWIAKTLSTSLRDWQNKTQRPQYDEFKLRFHGYQTKRIRKKGTMILSQRLKLGPGILQNIFFSVWCDNTCGVKLTLVARNYTKHSVVYAWLASHCGESTKRSAWIILFAPQSAPLLHFFPSPFLNHTRSLCLFTINVGTKPKTRTIAICNSLSIRNLLPWNSFRI